jgi:hypothetical protein
MQHFTCDLCGKRMHANDDRRYVVKMEVYAAHDPDEITDDDLDQDHMDALSEMLDECDADEPPAEDSPPTYKKIQYDLCPECQRRFLRDPLGKEAAQKFHFSEN